MWTWLICNHCNFPVLWINWEILLDSVIYSRVFRSKTFSGRHIRDIFFSLSRALSCDWWRRKKNGGEIVAFVQPTLPCSENSIVKSVECCESSREQVFVIVFWGLRKRKSFYLNNIETHKGNFEKSFQVHRKLCKIGKTFLLNENFPRRRKLFQFVWSWAVKI